MASLEAIQKTNIVRVPQPIKVIDLPGEEQCLSWSTLR